MGGRGEWHTDVSRATRQLWARHQSAGVPLQAHNQIPLVRSPCVSHLSRVSVEEVQVLSRVGHQQLVSVRAVPDTCDLPLCVLQVARSV